MNAEIEAKFAKIDVDLVREKLKKIGAVCVYPERFMRRRTYQHPNRKDNDWFRVRDEGDKITMSYKKLVDRTLCGTLEISFPVPDFNEACAFLDGAKLDFASYQETKRELWKLDNSEITIDTWPWIPTFLEIESPTEGEVKDIAKRLGFDWASALHGSVENLYMIDYGVTEADVDSWSEITFSPVPDWLEKKRKS